MKWHGKIGFSKTEETSPGIWTDGWTERSYYGEVLTNVRRWDINPESINDNLKIQNRISVIADSYAKENIGYMKKIYFQNMWWKITSLEILYPRIIITLGGEYNE